MKRIIVAGSLLLIILFSLTGCNDKVPLLGGWKKEIAQYQIGDQLELNTGLASGAFKVTIVDSTLISDASFLPNQELFFEQYSHHVSTDGKFVEGSYLVVIDLEVESVGAEAKFDPDYNDPYIFRIDSLFTLVDISEKQGRNYRYQNIDYFSLLNEQSIHPFAYILEPGETLSFQIGFFMGKKKDGSERLLDNLYLCTSSGNRNSDFVILSLEETQ